MGILGKIFRKRKKEKPYKTFGELIKYAKTPEEMGIKPIEESAMEASTEINARDFNHNRYGNYEFENKRYIG